MELRREEKMNAPRGVLGCLTAGFEVLSSNLDLVVIPALLDLLLWFGPRLSVAPLLQRLSALFEAQASANPDMAQQAAQVVPLLEQFGQRFNLVSLLSSLPMLHVPSLLAQHSIGKVSPLNSPRVFSITSILTFIPWWMGLLLAGLVLGGFYLNELANRMSIPRGLFRRERHKAADDAEKDRGMSSGMWKMLRLLLFESGLLFIWAVFSSLWFLLTGIATLIAEPIGVLIWVLGVALTIYLALHLIFVIPSILIGGRGLLQAVWESVMLSHSQLPSVLGLVGLGLVIYKGLGYAWSLPDGDSWLLLIGVLGNSAIAAGLLAAIFIFYRDRLVASAERTTDRDM